MPRAKKGEALTPKEQKPKKKTAIEMTKEEMEQVIANKKQVEVNQCTKEVNECLRKYGCRIDVGMLLKAGQIIPQVTITKNEQK